LPVNQAMKVSQAKKSSGRGNVAECHIRDARQGGIGASPGRSLGKMTAALLPLSLSLVFACASGPEEPSPLSGPEGTQGTGGGDGMVAGGGGSVSGGSGNNGIGAEDGLGPNDQLVPSG